MLKMGEKAFVGGGGLLRPLLPAASSRRSAMMRSLSRRNLCLVTLKPEQQLNGGGGFAARFNAIDVRPLALRPELAKTIYDGDEALRGKNWLKDDILDEREVAERLSRMASSQNASSRSDVLKRFLSLSHSLRNRPDQPPSTATTTLSDFELYLKNSHETMTLEELLISVTALRFLPEATDGVVKLLEKASFDRIYLFRAAGDANDDKPQYLRSYRDRLELAKAWIYSSSSSAQSFPRGLVAKCCSRSGTLGMFKSLTPTTFLDLCLVVHNLRCLGNDFHRYYIVYKFFEMFEWFDVNAVAAVCRTFNKFALYLVSSHPVQTTLTGNVVAKMKRDHRLLDGDNLIHLTTYLRNVGGVLLEEDLNLIQDRAAERKDELKLSSLVSLAAVGSKPSRRLAAAIRTNLTERSAMTVDDLINLVDVIQTDDDGSEWNEEERRKALADVVAKRFNDLDPFKGKLVRRLHLLCLLVIDGVFDADLVVNVLKDPRLVKPSKKDADKLAVSDAITYGVRDGRTQLARRLFCIVHGLTALTRQGQDLLHFLCPTSVKLCYEWMDVPLPSSASAKRRDDDDDVEQREPEKTFAAMGIEIFNMLRDFVGERQPAADREQRYVLETSLLPFFGTVDYLMLFDRRSGNFAPIPERWLSAAHLHDVKLPCDSLRQQQRQHLEWMVLRFVHRQKHLVHRNFRQKLTERHFTVVQLRKVGYKVIGIVDGTMHDRYDGTKRQLTDLVRSQVYDCLKTHLDPRAFPRSQL